MLTVKEFCEKYQCDCSGIYKKIKRKDEQIIDRLDVIGGKIVMDEYAEKLLIPKRRKNAEYERLSMAYSEMEYRLNRQSDILRDQLNSANEEIAFLKNRISQLEEKCKILESEKADLHNQLNEILSKPRGLFQRKS